MTVSFSAEDKKVTTNEYFSEGIHKVTIAGVSQDVTNGKEYFEFQLEGQNGETGSSRLYWSDAAKPYSFNTLRTIFVHNTPESNKEKMRAQIEACKNTDELFKLCAALIGKECWFVLEKTDRTYVNANGETKFSYNRNLYGYEPKPKKATAEDILVDLANGTVVDISEIPFE